MKLQICRASGLPVKFSDIEAYNEAYRQLYDRIKVHVIGTGELMTDKEAARMHRLLARLSPRVLAQFKLVEILDTTGTQKSWLELVAQHGPIALAKNSATGKLAAIILDAAFGG